MRDFRKFDIWELAMQISDELFVITKTLPDAEKFGLISQMNRCAVSLPSNIAEGCSRTSDKEFARFLEISLGSSFELQTQLEICIRRKYIPAARAESLLETMNIFQKRTNTLRTKLIGQTRG